MGRSNRWIPVVKDAGGRSKLHVQNVFPTSEVRPYKRKSLSWYQAIKDVSRRWDVDAVVDTTHLLANQLTTRCIYYKEKFNGNKTGVHQKDFGDAPGIYKTYTRHCRSLKNNSACVPLLTRDDKWTDSNLSKVETLPKTQQVSHNVATTPRTGPRSKTRLSAVAVHVQTYSVMNARIWHTVWPTVSNW